MRMSNEKKKDMADSDMYYFFEGKRGREFYLRLKDGVDLLEGIKQFVKDKKIRIAKIHAAFLGSFQPVKYEFWTPDTRDPKNWHNLSVANFGNINQILGINGVVHTRIIEGKEQTVVMIHGITGGGWDTPTVGGHFREGTIVKGGCGVFITELLGMEGLINPS